MFDCLGHLALAGLTVLSWLGAGTVLLRPLGAPGDRLLDALNRIGVGAIAFALLTFAAALLGLLHTAAYAPLFAASALIGALAAVGLSRGAPRLRIGGWAWWERALAALVAAYVVAVLVATCAPVTAPDALLYHVSHPALFAREHGFVEVPTWPAYQPFTVEMLILDGILLWNPVQGAFAPMLLALGALAAVAGAARWLAGRSAAFLAAAVFFAQPFMAWVASSSFVEPGLAFAVALGGWNVARFVRLGDRDSLLVAAVLAGGAAGMKYVGLAVALALGATGAALARRRLDARTVAVFAAPAILVALPWYAKNAILTGDPVYPLLAGDANPEAAESRRQVLEGYGHGRSALDALLLPFRLLGDAEAFDRGEFVSPLFLMFAPLALLVRGARTAVAAVLLAASAYLGAWFLASQQARFLTALMPPLALLAAVGVLALARRGTAGRLLSVAAVAGALTAGAAVTAVYAAQFVPVVLGTQTDREYLREKTTAYEAVEWINANLPRDARVLVDFASVLYLERDHEHLSLEALSPRAGPERTRAFIEQTGITHAAIVAAHEHRVRQMEYADARVLARLVVHEVRSRTLAAPPIPFEMLVYELP
ncbi:MAG TPA: hypothetical protein VM184_03225 [Gaiellaceae bacterium]|nr:hypothetical protein [Gaiellaceae bacterium]